MYGYGAFWNGFHWWWIIPVAMMILCFVMMRRQGGCVMGWSGSHHKSESAREILDKRYALGEIGKEEYEQKKRDIGQGGGRI
jgi:putative membrane protein